MGNAGTAFQLSMLEYDVPERSCCCVGDLHRHAADLDRSQAWKECQAKVEDTESRVVEGEQLEAEIDKMEK